MSGALLILGAGGHGISVADVAQQTREWEAVHFLDDDPNKKEWFGFPVVGRLADSKDYTAKYQAAFVAIGDNRLRLEWLQKLSDMGYELPALIHPHTAVGSMVSIGRGSVVMAGVCVNIGSFIGRGCILNTGCTVDHTCKLGEGVHLSPGVHMGGDVQIGRRTWICTGVSIGHNVQIAGDCVIAAGAAVVKNIEKPGMYAGNLAEWKKGSGLI